MKTSRSLSLLLGMPLALPTSAWQTCFNSNRGQTATLRESKCATAGCHATGGAGGEHWEWSTDYDTVKEHFGHMLEAVEAGTMPEEGSTELTDEEMDQLLCWKEAGFPE